MAMRMTEREKIASRLQVAKINGGAAAASPRGDDRYTVIGRAGDRYTVRAFTLERMMCDCRAGQFDRRLLAQSGHVSAARRRSNGGALMTSKTPAFVAIDWTREPLTERERKIRRAMLERILRGSFAFGRICALLPFAERRGGATDWRAAYAQADEIVRRESEAYRREQLEAAIAAVDENERRERRWCRVTGAPRS